MPDQDKEFKRRLLETFMEEAGEHLQAITNGLIDLENTPTAERRGPIVENIFREAHSLKGAARAVNVGDIESVCQAMEGVFAKAKRNELSIGVDAMDVLHRAVDDIGRLLAASRREGPVRSPADIGGLVAMLDAVSGGKGSIEQPLPIEPGGPGPAESVKERSVRVSAEQLDRLLLEVEELVPPSMAAAHRAAELRELSLETAQWKREWAKVQFPARSLRQSIDRDGEASERRGAGVRRLLDFLEWNEEFSGRLGTRLNALSRVAEHDQRSLGGMVDSLLRDTKLLLLRPFSTLTETFPGLVRDLCRQHGKEALLRVQGAEIEIDRRILQEIKDPLIHIMRNCLDHGIETPEERARSHKEARGMITIAVERKSATRIEVAISDDGAGIDPRKVREAASKAGIIRASSSLTMEDAEIIALIFRSGVTTSPIVTDISGRGLGMAIVREKVERLGGEITLDTRLGEGTTFRLLLPVTTSTLRGLLIRVAGQGFIIPGTYVERAALTRSDALRTVENRATVLVSGEAVAFVSLRQVIGLPLDDEDRERASRRPMVVLAASDKRIAFEVDEVAGEQEVLVKNLGPQLVRVRNVGGAAVLGSGKLVPILNVADLMKSAIKAAALPTPAWQVEQLAPRERQSILVVDDSITARTLLKSILEGAGYIVRTAVDGAEAFATLRETEFDLVVSDVDMPRLNGFELTAKIRAHKKLADLPVILVTALESREDRERGIDVGANAYIVKSSFEQSNLLDVVRRSL